jgi:ABC-2 type transport system ATP-binding protein
VSYKYKSSISKDYSFKSLFSRPLNNSSGLNSQINSIHSITFSIQKGEKVGIIGRNGAGKSTLVRLIAGVLLPDSGTVKTTGTMAPLMGYGLSTDLNLSLDESLRLYFLYRGCDPKFIDGLIDKVLRDSELSNCNEHMLATLSSGTSARLSFYAGIAVKSDVILLDEFSATGDLGFVQKSKADLNKFLDNDSTLVTVSHDLKFLLEVTNRCFWLQDGKIIFDGPSSDVIAKYTSSFEIL